MAYPPITWDQANFPWNSNQYTWDDVRLILDAAAGEEIKQYKIKAKDIRIAVKEILGTQMIAENVSI